MTELWQPSAEISSLHKRAEIIAQIRQFFANKGVLEVDTPSMSHASVTDVHLASFKTMFVGPGFAKGAPLYLQTSPEFAMKRLLAAGCGPIYQICKSFRNEESGRHHNPEFTMLEWYRPGFNASALMAEIDELMQQVLHCQPAERKTYRDAFIDVLELDPLSASLAELKALACQLGYQDIAQDERDKDTLLQLLFCMHVEPKIGQQRPCFIYHFPASQAALAKLNHDNPAVAERFELYYQNMELANGFDELTDSDEQAQRFAQDNLKRESLGLEPVAIDKRFIAALSSGLPSCSGVALGIDRLVMLALNKKTIAEVIAFDITRA